jgi:hypothetical protein
MQTLSGHRAPPCHELTPAAALDNPFDLDQLVSMVKGVIGSCAVAESETRRPTPSTL